MSVLFEQPYRGAVWRLEVVEHQGRIFGNLRKWYHDGDAWKPTREGVTLSLERLAVLGESVAEYFARPQKSRS